MADRSAHSHRRKTAFAPIRAVGCMSGTSLDGVDAAELSTDGERVFEFGATAYRPYNDAERNILRAALGHWPGTPEAAAAAILVEGAHAEVLSQMDVPEVVGFHGQTLSHEPQGRGTFQAGDGAALAKRIHRRVVWDFRSADIALGGQGAPLAPAYHFALAHYIKAEAPQLFLNLGGVGNLTWVDPSKPTPDTEGALLAFDTGPANAPLNDLMRQRRGVAFDQDGALAALGKISDPVVTRLLEQPYFHRIPPKSLDRNDFAWLLDAVAELDDADAAATLTAAAVMSVVQGMQHLTTRPERVLVTGGGRRNAVMMSMLATALALPVAPVEEVGLDGDMLEAQAFGFLAVRVMRGLPTSFPSTTGVAASVGGGEVSHVE